MAVVETQRAQLTHENRGSKELRGEDQTTNEELFSNDTTRGEAGLRGNQHAAEPGAPRNLST